MQHEERISWIKSLNALETFGIAMIFNWVAIVARGIAGTADAQEWGIMFLVVFGLVAVALSVGAVVLWIKRGSLRA